MKTIYISLFPIPILLFSVWNIPVESSNISFSYRVGRNKIMMSVLNILNWIKRNESRNEGNTIGMKVKLIGKKCKSNLNFSHYCIHSVE